jgi:hypothetical protein
MDDEEDDENPDGAVSPRRPSGGISPLGSPGLPGMHGDMRDTRAWNALGEIMGTNDEAISDSESIVTVGELGDAAHLDDMDEFDDSVHRQRQRAEEQEERERDREMGAFGRMQRRKSTENENSWAVRHFSPIQTFRAGADIQDMATKTLAALPRSPAERRRSSSGQRDSPLRTAILSPHELSLARKRSKSPSHGADSLQGLSAGMRFQDADVFDDEEVDLPGPMPIARETQDEVDRDFGAVDEVEYVYGE